MFDGWLVKTDSEGNELWNQSFGDIDEDLFVSVLPSYDGGYIAIGKSRPYGHPFFNAWAVKTDKDGNTLWEKRYCEDSDSSFTSIVKTPDEKYIAVGSIGSVPDGSVKTTFGVDHYDGLIIKFDDNGTEVWNQTFDSYDSSSLN